MAAYSIEVILNRQLADCLSIPVFITDTALTTPDIKEVLGKGYGEIMQLVQQKQLQPLKFMATYYTMQPPWTMDIAVAVNKLPEKMSGRVHAKILTGGEVLIAHM